MKNSPQFIYRKSEEIANAITHGVGALLAIAALVVLVVFSIISGTVWHVVGFSIFGGTLVLLYLASTLYHSLSATRARRLFQKFDHMSIFLLIAGTYTPFCLVALPGAIGWTILAITWACAITGIVMKAFFTGSHERLSTALYIAMGWLIVPAIKPLYNAVTFSTFLWLMAGGVLYTAGTYFFLKDQQKKFYHSVWHLFVLCGSVCHFFAVLGLLALFNW